MTHKETQRLVQVVESKDLDAVVRRMEAQIAERGFGVNVRSQVQSFANGTSEIMVVGESA